MINSSALGIAALALSAPYTRQPLQAHAFGTPAARHMIQPVRGDFSARHSGLFGHQPIHALRPSDHSNNRINLMQLAMSKSMDDTPDNSISDKKLSQLKPFNTIGDCLVRSNNFCVSVIQDAKQHQLDTNIAKDLIHLIETATKKLVELSKGDGLPPNSYIPIEFRDGQPRAAVVLYGLEEDVKDHFGVYLNFVTLDGDPGQLHFPSLSVEELNKFSQDLSIATGNTLQSSPRPSVTDMGRTFLAMVDGIQTDLSVDSVYTGDGDKLSLEQDGSLILTSLHQAPVKLSQSQTDALSKMVLDVYPMMYLATQNFLIAQTELPEPFRQKQIGSEIVKPLNDHQAASISISQEVDDNPLEKERSSIIIIPALENTDQVLVMTFFHMKGGNPLEGIYNLVKGLRPDEPDVNHAIQPGYTYKNFLPGAAATLTDRFTDTTYILTRPLLLSFREALQTIQQEDLISKSDIDRNGHVHRSFKVDATDPDTTTSTLNTNILPHCTTFEWQTEDGMDSIDIPNHDGLTSTTKIFDAPTALVTINTESLPELSAQIEQTLNRQSH